MRRRVDGNRLRDNRTRRSALKLLSPPRFSQLLGSWPCELQMRVSNLQGSSSVAGSELKAYDFEGDALDGRLLPHVKGGAAVAMRKILHAPQLPALLLVDTLAVRKVFASPPPF